jgi:hypothetical protein
VLWLPAERYGQRFQRARAQISGSCCASAVEC